MASTGGKRAAAEDLRPLSSESLISSETAFCHVIPLDTPAEPQSLTMPWLENHCWCQGLTDLWPDSAPSVPWSVAESWCLKSVVFVDVVRSLPTQGLPVS